jgi:hypothetical protein
MTIDLPDAIEVEGRIYSVKKIVNTNTATINPYLTQTIDGLSVYDLTEVNALITFQSDGANWRIIGSTDFDLSGSAQTALDDAKDYTDTAIDNIKDGVVPGLDTLQKIAQSLANNLDFNTTITNLLAAKLSIADASATYAPLVDPRFTNNIYRNISSVTQLTSESTAISINAGVGVINTFAFIFPANNVISFTVVNDNVDEDDIIFTQVITPNTTQTPLVAVRNIANGSFIITMRNITGSSINPGVSQKIAFQLVKKNIV